jgi:superfamily II RNA helicase
MLREMVEILFGKGLIKCLFATETFAVGINMPTKTVVFLDLEKYSDECQGLRPLRTDEYIQMAGRAGRRGKDTLGYVFYLPQRDPISLSEAKLMLTGRKSSIQSQMDFGYDFLLKTLQAKNLKWVELMDKSYWAQQRSLERSSVEKELANLHNWITNSGLSESELETCRVREEAEEWFATGSKAQRKEAQKVLEKLKNKQVGPAWEKLWKTWLTRKENLRKEKQEKEYLEYLNQPAESLLTPRFELLKLWGFLDEEKNLTKLGLYATEINEGQQILMAKAYEDGICAAMSQDEFVALLAAFLNEGKEKDEDPRLEDLKIPMTVKDMLYDIDEWAATMQKDEDRVLGPQRGDFWALKTTWIEPIYRWVGGESASLLCQEYGIYEGNLMRSILKVANMVEEWTNLATYTQNIEMLRLLEGLREKLVRGIAKPESLYLNLSN